MVLQQRLPKIWGSNNYVIITREKSGSTSVQKMSPLKNLKPNRREFRRVKQQKGWLGILIPEKKVLKQQKWPEERNNSQKYIHKTNLKRTPVSSGSRPLFLNPKLAVIRVGKQADQIGPRKMSKYSKSNLLAYYEGLQHNCLPAEGFFILQLNHIFPFFTTALPPKALKLYPWPLQLWTRKDFLQSMSGTLVVFVQSITV